MKLKGLVWRLRLLLCNYCLYMCILQSHAVFHCVHCTLGMGLRSHANSRVNWNEACGLLLSVTWPGPDDRCFYSVTGQCVHKLVPTGTQIGANNKVRGSSVLPSHWGNALSHLEYWWGTTHNTVCVQGTQLICHGITKTTGHPHSSVGAGIITPPGLLWIDFNTVKTRNH